MKVRIERFKKLDAYGNTKAFLDLCFEGQLIVTGFKIMSGEKGLWLAMPSQKGKDDKYYPTVKCISKEAQELLQAEVLRQAEAQLR